MNNRNKNKTRPDILNAALRRTEALKLRLKGKTFADIGEEMGVTPQTAHQYVKKAYELLLQQQNELAEEVRQLTKERLDALLAAHWEGAISGKDKPAAELVLKLIDRMAKLYGLDAAQKVQTDLSVALPGASAEELKAQARMMGVDITDLEGDDAGVGEESGGPRNSDQDDDPDG